jgi:hypothetical protein
MLKKKFLASFKRLVDFFTQKFVNKLKNMGLVSGIQDPGSEIRDPNPEKTYSGSRIRLHESKRHLIPDPGSRIPDPGYGSATLDANCIEVIHAPHGGNAPCHRRNIHYI